MFPTERFYARDLGRPALRFSSDPVHGRLAHAEQEPGLPQQPDPELLDTWTLERSLLRLR